LSVFDNLCLACSVFQLRTEDGLKEGFALFQKPKVFGGLGRFMVFYIQRGITIATIFIGRLASIILAIMSGCLNTRLAITRLLPGFPLSVRSLPFLSSAMLF